MEKHRRPEMILGTTAETFSNKRNLDAMLSPTKCTNGVARTNVCYATPRAEIIKVTPENSPKRFPYEVFAVKQKLSVRTGKSSAPTIGMKKIYLVSHLNEQSAFKSNGAPLQQRQVIDRYHVDKAKPCFSARCTEENATSVSESSTPRFLPEIKTVEHRAIPETTKTQHELLMNLDVKNGIRMDGKVAAILQRRNNNQIANLQLLLSKKKNEAAKEAEVLNSITSSISTRKYSDNSQQKTTIKLALPSVNHTLDHTRTTVAITSVTPTTKHVNLKYAPSSMTHKHKRSLAESAPTSKFAIHAHRPSIDNEAEAGECLPKTFDCTVKIQEESTSKEVDSTPHFAFAQSRFPKYEKDIEDADK